VLKSLKISYAMYYIITHATHFLRNIGDIFSISAKQQVVNADRLKVDPLTYFYGLHGWGSAVLLRG